MTSHEELFALAEKLKKIAEDAQADQLSNPLAALEDAASTIGRSFSGSWQGYHSRVYYAGFSPPPPGAHFSQEWGLMDNYMSSLGSRGDWREYDPEDVKSHIHKLAGVPSLEEAQAAASAASEEFESAQSEIVSILHTELDGHADGFLEGYIQEIVG